MAEAKRVLHVSAAIGGGLEAAVRDFIESTPRVTHGAVFARRGDFATGDIDDHELAYQLNVNGGLRALRRELIRAVDEFQPDVIHLHSVTAGIVGRVSSAVPSSVRIVYSPHSFFFDRLSKWSPLYWLAYMTERLLAHRTDVLAGVSPDECIRGERLGMRSTWVPNVARLSEPLLQSAHPTSREVLAVGRLSAQKDPKFFARVKRHADLMGLQAQWVWIGDGPSKYRTALKKAGVQVTGWIPRADVVARLQSTGVYVHSAAWEGNPISLLEVDAVGTAAVVRSIPSVVSLGHSPEFATPEKVAEEIGRLLASPRSYNPPRIATFEDQRDALYDVYAINNVERSVV